MNSGLVFWVQTDECSPRSLGSSRSSEEGVRSQNPGARRSAAKGGRMNGGEPRGLHGAIQSGSPPSFAGHLLTPGFWLLTPLLRAPTDSNTSPDRDDWR